MNVRKNRFIVVAIALMAVVLGFRGIVRADLLNNRIDAPIVDSYGMISFNASTGTLSTDPTQTFSWRLFMQDGAQEIDFDNQAAPLSISIQLDQNGNVIETTGDSPDLTISGSITIPGVGSFSGVLLTAKISEFGFQPANGVDITYNSFDFRFSITGGQLAGLWDGDDLGLYFDFDPTAQPFTGSFTTNFYGYFNSTRMGGIAPTPMGCTGVVTTMQIDQFETFNSVDSSGQPIYPVISGANAITFDLNVTDCDNNSATLGRVKRKGICFGRPTDGSGHKITLNPGDSFDINQNNYNHRFAKLVDPNICAHKAWTATPVNLTFDVLLREGCAAKSVLGPAFAKCACVSIKKEVSKDGGLTYLNANTPCCATNTTLKKGVSAFYYRYTVSSPCAADLQNIQISDPELGIAYTVPGTLASGASRVIDYKTIPSLAQPPANVCKAANVLTTQCGTKNTTVNYDPGVATVTANAVTDPRLSVFQQPSISVTDQDSANLKCQ